MWPNNFNWIEAKRREQRVGDQAFLHRSRDQGNYSNISMGMMPQEFSVQNQHLTNTDLVRQTDGGHLVRQNQPYYRQGSGVSPVCHSSQYSERDKYAYQSRKSPSQLRQLVYIPIQPEFSPRPPSCLPQQPLNPSRQLSNSYRHLSNPPRQPSFHNPPSLQPPRQPSFHNPPSPQPPRQSTFLSRQPSFPSRQPFCPPSQQYCSPSQYSLPPSQQFCQPNQPSCPPSVLSLGPRQPSCPPSQPSCPSSEPSCPSTQQICPPRPLSSPPRPLSSPPREPFCPFIPLPFQHNLEKFLSGQPSSPSRPQSCQPRQPSCPSRQPICPPRHLFNPPQPRWPPRPPRPKSCPPGQLSSPPRPASSSGPPRPQSCRSRRLSSPTRLQASCSQPSSLDGPSSHPPKQLVYPTRLPTCLPVQSTFALRQTLCPSGQSVPVTAHNKYNPMSDVSNEIVIGKKQDVQRKSESSGTIASIHDRKDNWDEQDVCYKNEEKSNRNCGVKQTPASDEKAPQDSIIDLTVDEKPLQDSIIDLTDEMDNKDGDVSVKTENETSELDDQDKHNQTLDHMKYFPNVNLADKDRHITKNSKVCLSPESDNKLEDKHTLHSRTCPLTVELEVKDKQPIKARHISVTYATDDKVDEDPTLGSSGVDCVNKSDVEELDENKNSFEDCVIFNAEVVDYKYNDKQMEEQNGEIEKMKSNCSKNENEYSLKQKGKAEIQRSPIITDNMEKENLDEGGEDSCKVRSSSRKPLTLLDKSPEGKDQQFASNIHEQELVDVVEDKIKDLRERVDDAAESVDHVEDQKEDFGEPSDDAGKPVDIDILRKFTDLHVKVNKEVDTTITDLPTPLKKTILAKNLVADEHHLLQLRVLSKIHSPKHRVMFPRADLKPDRDIIADLSNELQNAQLWSDRQTDQPDVSDGCFNENKIADNGTRKTEVGSGSSIEISITQDASPIIYTAVRSSKEKTGIAIPGTKEEPTSKEKVNRCQEFVCHTGEVRINHDVSKVSMHMKIDALDKNTDVNERALACANDVLPAIRYAEEVINDQSTHAANMVCELPNTVNELKCDRKCNIALKAGEINGNCTGRSDAAEINENVTTETLIVSAIEVNGGIPASDELSKKQEVDAHKGSAEIAANMETDSVDIGNSANVCTNNMAEVSNNVSSLLHTPRELNRGEVDQSETSDETEKKHADLFYSEPVSSEHLINNCNNISEESPRRTLSERFGSILSSNSEDVDVSDAIEDMEVETSEDGSSDHATAKLTLSEKFSRIHSKASDDDIELDKMIGPMIDSNSGNVISRLSDEEVTVVHSVPDCDKDTIVPLNKDDIEKKMDENRSSKEPAVENTNTSSPTSFLDEEFEDSEDDEDDDDLLKAAPAFLKSIETLILPVITPDVQSSPLSQGTSPQAVKVQKNLPRVTTSSGFSLDCLLSEHESNVEHEKVISDINKELKHDLAQGGFVKILDREEEVSVDSIPADQQQLLQRFSYDESRILNQRPGERVFDSHHYQCLFGRSLHPTHCGFTAGSGRGVEKYLCSISPDEYGSLVSSDVLCLCANKISSKAALLRWLLLTLSCHDDPYVLYGCEKCLLDIVSRREMSWFPDIADILSVMVNYGAQLETLVPDWKMFSIEDVRCRLLQQPDYVASQSSTGYRPEQLAQVLKLLSRLIFCSRETIPGKDLTILVTVMAKISLDENLKNLYGNDMIKDCVGAALRQYSKADWETWRLPLSRAIPAVSSHHHNQTSVIKLFPCTERGHFIQKRSSFIVLHNLLLGITDFTDELLQNVQIEDLYDVVTPMKDLLDSDPYALASVISLLDIYVGINLQLEDSEREQLKHLMNKVRQIRVRDKVASLDKIRLKDMIMRMTSSWAVDIQMLKGKQMKIFEYGSLDSPVRMKIETVKVNQSQTEEVSDSEEEENVVPFKVQRLSYRDDD